MELLNENELCRRLRICKDTLNRLKKGERGEPIPFLMVGNQYRYSWDDVLEWAKRNGKRRRA